MSKFDLTKPYTTRDGRKAFATVGPDGRLYGWAEQPSGGFDAEQWKADGHYFKKESEWDLVNPNVPVFTVKAWFNVYKHDDYCVPNIKSFASHEDADNSVCGRDRIACIEREISYVAGEGLNQP